MDADLQRLLAEAERIRADLYWVSDREPTSVKILTLTQIIIELVREVQRLREKGREPGGELEHT